MDAVTRAGFLAHARTSGFQVHLEQARHIIAEALQVVRNPYVAYSAGKDSGCLLWLVLEQAAAVAARILTSGESRLLHANLDEVLAWWPVRFPALDLREINVDHVFAPGCEELTWSENRKAGRGDIVRYLPTSGDFDGVFLGLRDEESNARRMANRKGTIRRYKDTRRDALADTYCLCPLARWTVQDVGALTCLHDLPLLAAYEAESLDTRTTMRLTGVAAGQNAAVALRLRSRGDVNRLLQRFPELSWWIG